MMVWWQLFSAALSGGFALKILEILYQEVRERWISAKGEAKTIHESLEPLLKSADELVGKLRSLAEQDFLPIRRTGEDWQSDNDFSSLVFLFAQFWSHVELVRSAKMNDIMGKSKKGKDLSQFFACLESRRVRLIDRISQRAIGETTLIDGRPMNYVEFIKHYESDEYVKRWVAPLLDILRKADQPDFRQLLLQNFVILHALIDTLDPKHTITHNRPATPNKLSRKSWRDLNYRVFAVYLNCVNDRPKYIGPPKGRP